MSSGFLMLPLGAGFGYACAAIALKRALGAGVSGSWVNLVCNVVMALCFQVLWLVPGSTPHFNLIAAPAICGLLFFFGQIFTFRAIATGDVSVATPLLGTKVVLVALFSVFLVGKPLPPSWWAASVLASLGIALISYHPGGLHRHLMATVGWSLGAAAFFAMADVLVQNWAPLVGYSSFTPLMFVTVGLLSLVYIPGLAKESRVALAVKRERVPVAALPWLLTGALVLGLQALAMISAIGIYGSATATNIIYGTRCLWSVLLVWVLGSIAGSEIDGNRAGVMSRRFAGALLLFAAMALVLR